MQLKFKQLTKFLSESFSEWNDLPSFLYNNSIHNNKLVHNYNILNLSKLLNARNNLILVPSCECWIIIHPLSVALFIFPTRNMFWPA